MYRYKQFAHITEGYLRDAIAAVLRRKRNTGEIKQGLERAMKRGVSLDEALAGQ